MLTHQPVLLDEVLDALSLEQHRDGIFVDATFGRGGHSAAILQRLSEHGRLIALDRDPAAIAAGREKFEGETRLCLVHRAFAQLQAALGDAGMTEVAGRVSGVLFDLGVSSPQLDDAVRGFSFMRDGPLDMRMDNTSGISAAEWLAKISERDLQKVISEYGEERFARRIANAIVTYRQRQPISSTVQLAELIEQAVSTREPGKHPATRTFQAIRMVINTELEQIQHALQQAVEILAPRGRLCVISFHSLEDQLVKQFMQSQSQDDPMYAGLPEIPAAKRAKLKRIGKAVHPGEDEVRRNPRARSAIMRVAERVAA
ncbi:MAG TPA: 16S rRNA (cytosine(1402)-N(4))-methyltransferase RsmH [Steroidobacteraceae bacterium]|nr:16S rRNA (cytosine(1402)-N(4))-methyltransferase RsmH [Steroidobacteraceae bacterium]